jgi:membrane-associated protease RseP (regulator of RpoE activity)
MFRNTLVAVLVGVGFVIGGASEAFAQSGPKTTLKPTEPQVTLKPQGLLVTRVNSGSTAAMQGIEVGDIITSVDGHTVRSLNDLNYRVGRAIGAAELQVIDRRSGEWNSVTVYPRAGRIGVEVQQTPVDDVRPIQPVNPLPDYNGYPVRPIRPIYPYPIYPVYPGWDWGVRPLPMPPYPWNGGMHPLPLPAPGGLPGR